MNRCSLRVTPKEQEGRAEEHSLFCRICWKNTFDLLTNPRFCAMIRNGLRDRSIWAHSSAGRAPRSQCGGQGFDPPWVHQSPNRESEGKSVTMVADFSLLSPLQYAYAARQGSVEKWEADYKHIPFRSRLFSAAFARARKTACWEFPKPSSFILNGYTVE